MESNREFNGGRLFVAEQLFRLHRAEYEALFGAMPPLDDTTRFPALTPETAGCVEVATPKGSTFACRGLPGRRRRLRRPGAGRPDAGHDGRGQRREGPRRLRAAAALRRRPLRSLARRRRVGARPQRAARRGAVRRARELRLLPRGPAPDRRRVPQRGPQPGHRRRRDPGPRRSRRRDGRRRRAHRSDEHRGRLQRRRSPGAARQPGRRAGGRVPHADAPLRGLAPQLHAHRTDHRRWLRSSCSSIAAAIRPAPIPARTSCTRSRSPSASAPISWRSWVRSPVRVRTPRCWWRHESVRALRRLLPPAGVGLLALGVRVWRRQRERPALRRGRAARRPVRPPGGSDDVRPAAGNLRLRPRPPSATPSRAGPRRAAAPASSIPRAGASSAARPTTAPASTTPSASDRR